MLPRVTHLSVGVQRPAADAQQQTQQQNTAEEHDVTLEEHGAEETDLHTANQSTVKHLRDKPTSVSIEITLSVQA